MIESYRNIMSTDKEEGMREIVRKLVEKYWDSNWHDSRTVEGEVEWIMKFADELVREWLRKFGKEVERQGEEGRDE